jgi:hypothetical protein
MPTTFRRTHSNGVTTWARYWEGVGWDYGVEPTQTGVIETATAHHQSSKEDAQAAADRLAHDECDDRCGGWSLREEG